ncbi:MAG: HIT domain-containing protein [Rhodopseudomonas sp.]|nr:HIT domain-containing protein [Rhodopseudomonas sp.]
MPPPAFALDPQLAVDTVFVGDLALCRVLLVKDANYPWILLVPRRPNVTEMIDLPDHEQIQLAGEVAVASRALRAITGCEKLNIASLGNVVSQLHIHVIGRRPGDKAWPKAVWGAALPTVYDPNQRDELATALRHALKINAIAK